MKWVIGLALFWSSIGFAQKADYTCGSNLVYSIKKNDSSADAFEIVRNLKQNGNFSIRAYYGKDGYREAIADFVIDGQNFAAEFDKAKVTPNKKAFAYHYDSEAKIYHQYETDVDSYELEGTQVIENRSTNKPVKVLMDIPHDLSSDPVTIMSVFFDNKTEPILFATWCQVFSLLPQKSKLVSPKSAAAQR